MSGTTFNRFVIAPSDDDLVKEYAGNPDAQPAALQCARLGAFGGFFEKQFRAHDYALGRKNCQKFLLDHFVLPEDNVIIKSGVSENHLGEIRSRFGKPPLGPYAGNSGIDPDLQTKPQDAGANEKRWLPIIPLCSEEIRRMVFTPERTTISHAKISLIVKLVRKRVRAIIGVWRAQIPSWPLKVFLWPGEWIIPKLAERPIRNLLRKQLGDTPD